VNKYKDCFCRPDVYFRLKHFLFTALYLLLWAQFFLMLSDPVMAGNGADQAGAGLPIYTSWRGTINSLYYAGDWVSYPIKLIYNTLYYFMPSIQSDAFPYISSVNLGQPLYGFLSAHTDWTWAKPATDFLAPASLAQKMPGVFGWFPLITMIFLWIVNPMLDHAVDFSKNMIWNVLIEFSFTKRKQAAYQDALEKRAEALIKLNTEYRNLSKEASQLKASVVTDELTQVYNKRFFIQKMSEEFENARKGQAVISLIMMDIDHFKKLNDTYGHLMGDKVLQQVAGVVKKATPQKCYCCRFGGEEFCVIMPGKVFDEAMAIAEIVKREVPLLRIDEEPELKVTISQGLCTVNFISSFAASLEKFDQFIKLADDELYRAKLEGRDRICTKRID
jgi:diguanylate cyclase (GGDEF)-like protein